MKNIDIKAFINNTRTDFSGLVGKPLTLINYTVVVIIRNAFRLGHSLLGNQSPHDIMSG